LVLPSDGGHVHGEPATETRHDGSEYSEVGVRLLITNDDGIDAPGLRALAQVATNYGQVVVVAPHEHHSGCGHKITTDRPLSIRQQEPGWFAVDGSPADCVRIALTHLAQDVDWVLAGINQGGNLGVDAFMSGTLAAAREAAFFGKSAVAVSQYHRGLDTICWSTAGRQTKQVLDDLLRRQCEPHRFWNINLPAPPQDGELEMVFCEPDHHPLPVQFEQEGQRFIYRGRYHFRNRAAGSDVDVCFSGRIAVSNISSRP
jgi:5'-nucleotidase